MHKVIEDWMLMANEAMASSIVRNHEESGSTLPLFLRIHTPPSLPDLLEAATDLGAKQLASLIQKRIESGETGEVSDGTGGTIPIENYVVRRMLRSAKLSPERLRNIWNGATERNETPAQTRAYIAEREKEAEAHVLAIVRRLFKKAEYATEVRAHFGLGKTPYTQGTSPIRRYADIRVHQIMDAGLHEGVSAINEASLSNLEETAGQANRREKVVSGAEDRSMRMRGAALLEEKIGKTATIRLEQARFFGDTLKSVRVRVPLPRGGYPLTFTVKPDAFAGLPQGYREIDALRGKDIEARLTGVDVAAGAISLEYQGT